MTVHLKKLSVGSISLDSLRGWQDARVANGLPIIHPTRNKPRRAEEILDGGSLYWVIKGQMVARQRIVDLCDVTRDNGRPACGIVLAPELFPVWPRRFRAFQGWRYLEVDDAPADMPVSDDATPLPAELASELRDLGLL